MEAQSYSNWELLAHEDGSDDQTIAILKEFVKKRNRTIKIISSGKQLGPMRSFELLMEHSSAEYIMFCNQDDVWLSHIIEESLVCIQQLEQENPDKAA